MATGFTGEMYPWCASYGVRCDGDHVVQEVHYLDGTVSYELAPPHCGREFCALRDDQKAVMGRVEKWVYEVS